MEMGNTRVICTASVVRGVPKWLEGKGAGWVTAEYAMLPASTPGRKRRATGKPDSRGVEIQRLVGRALRGVVRMEALGANTIYIDCDVLDADGGTRTASITGAYVALARALRATSAEGVNAKRALTGPIAAVSVGMVDGRAVLDLDYVEDSSADVDMNVAMVRGGKFVEVQGTSEGKAFDMDDLEKMLSLARGGIKKLMQAQKDAIILA